MNNKKQDISSDQEKILQYLSNNLNAGERHQLESEMDDDPFTQEAMEGLQNTNNGKITEVLQQLNASLHKEIKSGKRKKKNRFLELQNWIYFAVALILLLMIISYLVIRNMSQ